MKFEEREILPINYSLKLKGKDVNLIQGCRGVWCYLSLEDMATLRKTICKAKLQLLKFHVHH